MNYLGKMQEKVWTWCQETFEGIAAWQTTKERSYRFLEEATELFQATGMTKRDAYKVVDYVYGRDVGKVPQEIGGVMVTLLALASQQMSDVDACLSVEYRRITQPNIQQRIREKQLAKNQAFL